MEIFDMETDLPEPSESNVSHDDSTRSVHDPLMNSYVPGVVHTVYKSSPLLRDTHSSENSEAGSLSPHQNLDMSPPPNAQNLDQSPSCSIGTQLAESFETESPSHYQTLDESSPSPLQDLDGSPTYSKPQFFTPPSTNNPNFFRSEHRQFETYGGRLFRFPPNRNYSPLSYDGSDSTEESEPSTESDRFSSYKYSEVQNSMVGAGLANLGNTCFMNAVLQCFTHTAPLVQGIRSLNHTPPYDCRNKLFCVLCALREHFELCLFYSGGMVSPCRLVKNLNYISDDFQQNCQEDAHEFLQCFLDRLEDACPKFYSVAKMNFSENDNVVKHIFGGRLISKLRCCNCGHCSDTYEPHLGLSLEIKDVGGLSSALESFTKVEKMEDPENQFTCDRCNERVSGEKQLMLDSAPLVASFHLKRFENDGIFVGKIDKFVEYPLELDLKPFTSCIQETDVEMKYDLYAIVVHAGCSPDSGHYYCFVRSSPDTWYRLDDSKIYMVDERTVLSQQAYILFYAKKGTPWFSSLLSKKSSSASPTSPVENVHDIYVSSTSPITKKISHCKVREIIYDDGDDQDEYMVDSCEEGKSPSEFKKKCSEEEEMSCDRIDGVRSNNAESDPQTPPGSSSPGINGVSNAAEISPRTPHMALSPDIYSFYESPEVVFEVPRNHVQATKKTSSCKEPQNTSVGESKIREALNITKRMPSSRRLMLANAIRGSPEKKIERRKSSSPYGKDKKNKDRNKRHPTPLSMSH